MIAAFGFSEEVFLLLFFFFFVRVRDERVAFGGA
jgi:hypothetical protein